MKNLQKHETHVAMLRGWIWILMFASAISWAVGLQASNTDTKRQREDVVRKERPVRLFE